MCSTITVKGFRYYESAKRTKLYVRQMFSQYGNIKSVRLEKLSLQCKTEKVIVSIKFEDDMAVHRVMHCTKGTIANENERLTIIPQIKKEQNMNNQHENFAEKCVRRQLYPLPMKKSHNASVPRPRCTNPLNL